MVMSLLRLSFSSCTMDLWLALCEEVTWPPFFLINWMAKDLAILQDKATLGSEKLPH